VRAVIIVVVGDWQSIDRIEPCVRPVEKIRMIRIDTGVEYPYHGPFTSRSQEVPYDRRADPIDSPLGGIHGGFVGARLLRRKGYGFIELDRSHLGTCGNGLDDRPRRLGTHYVHYPEGGDVLDVACGLLTIEVVSQPALRSVCRRAKRADNCGRERVPIGLGDAGRGAFQVGP